MLCVTTQHHFKWFWYTPSLKCILFKMQLELKNVNQTYNDCISNKWYTHSEYYALKVWIISFFFYLRLDFLMSFNARVYFGFSIMIYFQTFDCVSPCTIVIGLSIACHFIISEQEKFITLKLLTVNAKYVHFEATCIQVKLRFIFVPAKAWVFFCLMQFITT